MKLPAAKPEPARPDFLSHWAAVSEPVFTYFIQDDAGPVKVGQAKKPLERLTLLQCGNPRTLHLRMVLPHDIEFMMHWRFKDWRVRGEWFGRDETEQQIILAYAEQLNLEAREDWDGSSEPPENREFEVSFNRYLASLGAFDKPTWAEVAARMRQEGMGAAAIAKELGMPEPEVAAVLLKEAA